MNTLQRLTRWLGLTLTCSIITFAASVEAKKGGGGPPPPQPSPEALFDLILPDDPPSNFQDGDINEAGLVLGTTSFTNDFDHPTLLVPQEENGSTVWYKDDDSDGKNDLLVDLGLPGWGDLNPETRDLNDHGVILGGRDREYDGLFYDSAWILAPQVVDGQLRWANLDTNGVNSLIAPVYVTEYPTLEVDPRDINNHGEMALIIESPHEWQRGYLLLPTVYDVSPDGAVTIKYPAEDLDGDGFNDALISLGSGVRLRDGAVVPLLPQVINDLGDVAGLINSDRPFALRPCLDENLGLVWNQDTNHDGANDLVVYLTLPAGVTQAYIRDMNETGTIVVGEVYYDWRKGDRGAIWQVDWESRKVTSYTEIELGKRYQTMALSVNTAGQVVGSAEGGLGWIWDQGNMALVSDLVPGLAGHTVVPTGITDSGMIIGYYYDTSPGPTTSFIAVPIEQP